MATGVFYSMRPIRLIFLLCLILAVLPSAAQDDPVDPTHWLAGHHYAFSLTAGFEGPLADTLARQLSAYRLILQAEGGSHFLHLYDTLEVTWLRFLHERLGISRFVGESGSSVSVLYNPALLDGDTSLRGLRRVPAFVLLAHYNSTLPPAGRISYSGVDFETSATYIPALRSLLPAKEAPPAIRDAMALIRQSPDSGLHCGDIVPLNRQLRASMDREEAIYRDYLGKAFADFSRIVRNNGSCQDAFSNRNKHLAANILALDQTVGAEHYYGEFGEAHTILKNKVLAGLLMRSGPFKDKVAVINLYCAGCSTPEEEVSNWPLRPLEADIQKYFLPLCTTDYTFFDLSGDAPGMAKYRAYGQYLIVARRQH